jgi:hypothetical protein
MHASLTACTLFILKPPAIGLPLSIYYLLLTAALWVVIAAIVRPTASTLREPSERVTRGESASVAS